MPFAAFAVHSAVFSCGTAGKGTSCWESYCVVSVKWLSIYKKLNQGSPVFQICYKTDSDDLIFLPPGLSLVWILGAVKKFRDLPARLSGCLQQFITWLASEPPGKKQIFQTLIVGIREKAAMGRDIAAFTRSHVWELKVPVKWKLTLSSWLEERPSSGWGRQSPLLKCEYLLLFYFLWLGYLSSAFAANFSSLSYRWVQWATFLPIQSLSSPLTLLAMIFIIWDCQYLPVCLLSLWFSGM